MAAPITITDIQTFNNSGVYVARVFFTSAGATNERMFMQRTLDGLPTPKWETVRLQSRSTVASFYDYTVPMGGATYRYRVVVTDSDYVSNPQVSNEFLYTSECYSYSTISPVDSVGGMAVQYNMNYATSRDSSRGRVTSYHKFAGRVMPAMEKAIQRSNSVKVSWYVDTWSEVELFHDLMVDKNFWFRDNSGRSFNAGCSDIDIVDGQVSGYTLSTTITEIDGGAVTTQKPPSVFLVTPI